MSELTHSALEVYCIKRDKRYRDEVKTDREAVREDNEQRWAAWREQWQREQVRTENTKAPN